MRELKIEILDEAEQDLLDGFRFYESQKSGLGDYFLDFVFADIESLQSFGGIHQQSFGYYRLLTKRFPYAVYYRTETDVAKIYAILDCRQDPGKIRERLA